MYRYRQWGQHIYVNVMVPVWGCVWVTLELCHSHVCGEGLWTCCIPVLMSVWLCVPLMVFVMQSTSTTVCHSDEACLHGTHCHQVYMLPIQCHVSLIMSLWLHLQVGGFVPGTVYTLVRLCRLLCLTLVYGCDSAGRGLWLCHCYP